MGRLSIVSEKAMLFADRWEAGKLLAGALEAYRESHPIVLGIPRGGVVLSFAIAESMRAQMDVVLAHKIGAPGNPEFAIGAVSEKGDLVLSEEARQIASPSYLKQEKERQADLLSRRMKQYRTILPKLPLKDRVAIIADDGVAVGLTAEASIRSVRTENPACLILALPVGPIPALERLSRLADETIVLCAPYDFFSVSQYYDSFPEVDDRKVMELLQQMGGASGGKKELKKLLRNT